MTKQWSEESEQDARTVHLYKPMPSPQPVRYAGEFKRFLVLLSLLGMFALLLWFVETTWLR